MYGPARKLFTAFTINMTMTNDLQSKTIYADDPFYTKYKIYT